MKALYNVLKDHKHPMIQDLINSSYEHCCREEMEMLVGDGDLLDSDIGILEEFKLKNKLGFETASNKTIKKIIVFSIMPLYRFYRSFYSL